ncbi:hypothetical protein [Luteimonas fraxinea]|uniref:Uncharacterized protein n=1 Tax=Luteimonas fraxinea TaxID=2901869 RepID=A0ABS8UB93_9GAMM|nr:hypothetical protein [Luteimonas fraxinea]MCD9096786.1 hypothetical protein [Luteimonas fraxinea]
MVTLNVGTHIPDLPLSAQPQARNAQSSVTAQSPPEATQPTSPPATTPQANATNDAAAEHRTASGALDSIRLLSAQGHGFARAELNDGYLQQNVSNASEALETSIDAEIDALISADPGLSDADAAALVSARFEGFPELQAGVDAAIEGVLPARQSDALIQSVPSGSEPGEALYALNEVLQGAPMDLRQRVLADSRVQTWLTDVAAQVTTPLQPYLEDPGQIGERNYPQDMLDGIRGLEQIANELDDDLAAALTEAALPAFEQVNESVFGGSGMFSGGGAIWADEGLARIVQMSSHISGAEGSQALTNRLIDLAGGTSADWGRAADAVIAHNGIPPRSIGPALFVELERQGVDVGQGSPVLASMDPIRNGIELSIQPDAAEFYELTETFRFAQEMRPLYASDTEFEAALDALMTESLGADWQAQIQAQQDVMASHGSRLLNQLAQYTDLPADNPLRSDVDTFISEVLNDPVAQAAISMALRADPALAQGPLGDSLLDLFSIGELGAAGQGLATEFANLYISTQSGAAISGLDGGNPATIAAADAQLASLVDPRLAEALGVEPAALESAIGAMRESLPGLAGDDTQREAAQRAFNTALNGIEGFTADDAAGQLLRGMAVTASASALINAQGLQLDDPRVESLLDIAIGNLEFLKSANFTGKALISLAVGAELISATGFIGKYGLSNALTGRLFAAAGIAADTWNAIQAFQDGDAGAGTLHVTAAGGVLAGVLGAGTWLGPVGWTVAALSYIGLGAIDRAAHNNRFETDDMRNFLAASGLSDAAASVLYDTTGNAVSPVPFLLQYAQSHGLSPDQAIAWFNQLAETDQLSGVVHIAHQTIDEAGGNGTDLPGTHASDSEVADTLDFTPHHAVAMGAQSMAQFDMLLQTFDIPPPA